MNLMDNLNNLLNQIKNIEVNKKETSNTIFNSKELKNSSAFYLIKEAIKFLDLETYLNIGYTCKEYYHFTHSLMGLCELSKTIKTKIKPLDLFKRKNPQSETKKKEDKSSSNGYGFGLISNIFSTINDYTYGALVNKKQKETSLDDIKFKEIKEKLSYWEEILEEILNQKTLEITIIANRKVVEEIYDQKINITKKSLPEKALDERVLNNKYKQNEKELLTKKDSFVNEYNKLKAEIEELEKKEKEDEIQLFKIKLFFETLINKDVITKTKSIDLTKEELDDLEKII